MRQKPWRKYNKGFTRAGGTAEQVGTQITILRIKGSKVINGKALPFPK